ncbi:MAG: S41 family peptidase [Patescibacteria group bacterium]
MQNKREKTLLVPILSLIIIVLVFALGFVMGRMGFNVAWDNGEINYTIKGQLYPEEKEVNFDHFWDVWNRLESQYVDKDLNEEDMVNGAIKGMVASLGDRATRYYTAEETQEYEFQRSGGLEGIGIELGYLDNKVIIKKVFENTPAEKSGLLYGDIISEVDGEDISFWDIYDVASKIRGEKGTKIKLLILRDKDEQVFEVERDEVFIKSIDWEMLENDLALITVRRFTENDFASFALLWDRVISDVAKENPAGIIIDLRGNGGGFLDGATYLAGEFVDKGSVILFVKGREGKLIKHKVERDGKFKELPLVLLVDSETASSSEIFAGALQYYKRATIIGEDTFGKGTAQDVVEPADWGGASVHITTQKWLFPDKRWINEDDPIHPDIEVELDIETFKKGEDPQLAKAVETLLK